MTTALDLPTGTSKAEVKPVAVDVFGASTYTGRSVKALRRMRERRVGPRSFLQQGRVMYMIADLDAWFAEGYKADSRSNPALDPTLKPPEPKRARAARPRNGDGASARTLTPLASSTPTRTSSH